MPSSHLRTIAETIFGSGDPVGRNWVRRAVEITGEDVSAVRGPWAKKLYVALGGDLNEASGPWMKSIAVLLECTDLGGSWDRKVAFKIADTGGIVSVTFDSDNITFDNDNLTFDRD